MSSSPSSAFFLSNGAWESFSAAVNIEVPRTNQLDSSKWLSQCHVGQMSFLPWTSETRIVFQIVQICVFS